MPLIGTFGAIEFDEILLQTHQIEEYFIWVKIVRPVGQMSYRVDGLEDRH